ncbi:hypothetical protein HDU93_009995 [Gonapodya sp. JEL0774]|nr:hypothetical protein HDU93_009995 [Gonapodya sp. JEL0774]
MTVTTALTLRTFYSYNVRTGLRGQRNFWLSTSVFLLVLANSGAALNTREIVAMQRVATDVGTGDEVERAAKTARKVMTVEAVTGMDAQDRLASVSGANDRDKKREE